MSIRKARAWATFTLGLIFLLVTAAVGVLTMTEYRYNDRTLPELPEHDEPYATIVGITEGLEEGEPIPRYVLMLSNVPPYIQDFNGKPTIFWDIAGDARCRCFDYLPDENDYIEGEEPGWTEEEDFQEYLVGQGFEEAYVGFEHIWIWSNANTDIYDEEGNLIYEGTDPVRVKPAFCLRSWLTGYVLGLAGKPMLPESSGKTPDTQPTAYSYNGVVLPKLPEWDKTVYPYAVIYNSIKNAELYGTRVKVLTQPVAYQEYNILFVNGLNGKTYGVHETSGTYESIDYVLSDSEWVKDPDDFNLRMDIEVISSSASYAGVKGEMLWSNYDINNLVDGGIYLAASEPTPVYE